MISDLFWDASDDVPGRLSMGYRLKGEASRNTSSHYTFQPDTLTGQGLALPPVKPILRSI